MNPCIIIPVFAIIVTENGSSIQIHSTERHLIYSKRRKHLRFELAQTRKYSLNENVVNDFVSFFYDGKELVPDMTKNEQRKYNKTAARIADGEIIEQKSWKMIRELNSFSEEKLSSTALVSGTRKYTYRQMFRQWERYAEVFSALEITEDAQARAGVVSTPSLVSVFTFYGLNMTGASASMIPHMDITDMENLGKMILQEGITDLILVDNFLTPPLLHRILRHKAEWGIRNMILEHIPLGGPCGRRDLETQNRMNYRLLRQIPGVLFMEDLLEKYEAAPIRYGNEGSQNAALILHTSGTTGGIHKPIPLSDRAFNEAVVRMLRDDRFRELEGSAVCGLGIELASSYCTIDMMHLPLAFGGTVIALPMGQLDSALFAKAVQYYGINVLFASDILIEAWMKIPAAPDLSNLSHVFLGGSYVSAESKQRYDAFLKKCGSNTGIAIGYGISEAGASCILASPDRTDDAVGYPLPGVRVKLYNEEEDRFFTPEEGPGTGVLYLSTPSLSNGQIDNEVFFTLEEIDGEPWLNTYDLFRVNEDGSLACIGRMNRFFVNNDGIRFDAGLVETAVSSQPGIRACGLVPAYNKVIHDTIPVLYVQTTTGERNQLETVRKALCNVFIRDNLISETNMPGQCVLAGSLPVTATGKIDVHRITIEGAKGRKLAVIPVRRGDKLENIRLVPAGMDGTPALSGIPEELSAFPNLFSSIQNGLGGTGLPGSFGQPGRGCGPGHFGQQGRGSDPGCNGRYGSVGNPTSFGRHGRGCDSGRSVRHKRDSNPPSFGQHGRGCDPGYFGRYGRDGEPDQPDSWHGPKMGDLPSFSNFLGRFISALQDDEDYEDE